MDPTDKNLSKFYCTFKVHKNHKEGEAPPERPIISSSGSITENQSLFLEHHGREDSINKERIFKINKNNSPKNHKTPDDLKVYLEAAKWELIDNKNRIKTERNMPSEEVKAIKELIQLQKDRLITIKPCNKGAGIIILDFQEYLRACTDHLNSKQLQTNRESVIHYEKVNSSVVQEAKSKIKSIWDEGYDNLIISKEEYEAMDPTDKNPSKFYCTFKVHENHKEGEAPPERPIIIWIFGHSGALRTHILCMCVALL